MRCPVCKSLVDPVTSERWIEMLDMARAEDNEPSPVRLLQVIYEWDQSAMSVGGQSVLPTELRDAIFNVLALEEES